VVIAGNPVISTPDPARLDEALEHLDLMVSVDNWLNETSRRAHVILPGHSALEQPHYDELFWGWSTRNATRYSPSVFASEDGRPAEWEILLRLAALLGGQSNDEIDLDGFDGAFFSGVVAMEMTRPGSRIAGRDPADIVAATPGRGPERLLEFGVRVGPQGDAYGSDPDGLTLDDVKAHEHGLDIGPLEPRLPDVLETADGRIDLAPPHIVDDVARLRARLERVDDGLVLVSRRHLRSNNSWMHNVSVLVRGKDRCTLEVHPEDAARAGLRAGAVARVSSESGAVEVPVEITDAIIPGVVCLPHGWGHDLDGVRLSVASEHAGVNSNLLAPGHLVDPPSGNAVVNGIPVEIAPA
jgi:anaerobic selenocysteine-containing dehydrogenase